MENLFELWFAFAFTGGIGLVLALMEVIYNIMYKTLKWFRRAMDRFFDSLPDWED